MGFLSNLTGAGAAPVTLQPFQPHLGINQHFCMPQPTTLVMKEAMWSFSGDDFSCKDANGATVLKVKGKSMSFTDKKVFHDPQGNELFSLNNKMIAIHKTFVGSHNGQDLFTVKKKMSIGTSKMIATFKNLCGGGEEVELVCKGNIFDKACTITIGDRPVATISRSMMNAREMMRDSQTYYVTVAAGVDLSLMAALAIAFDECNNEK